MSPEYEAALATANEASVRFTKAQLAYRAREIGDAEFLAARAAYKLAEAAFDVAFAKERSMILDDLLFALENVSPQVRGYSYDGWLKARDAVIAFVTAPIRCQGCESEEQADHAAYMLTIEPGDEPIRVIYCRDCAESATLTGNGCGGFAAIHP